MLTHLNALRIDDTVAYAFDICAVYRPGLAEPVSSRDLRASPNVVHMHASRWWDFGADAYIVSRSHSFYARCLIASFSCGGRTRTNTSGSRDRLLRKWCVRVCPSRPRPDEHVRRGGYGPDYRLPHKIMLLRSSSRSILPQSHDVQLDVDLV
jgi:hypothetical protein